MSWDILADTPSPMLRWQALLTAEAPDPGPLPLALVTTPTVQVEGTFGAGALEVSGSNSGDAEVPLDVLRHADVRPVLPVVYLWTRAVDADGDTALLVTVAGRR